MCASVATDKVALICRFIFVFFTSARRRARRAGFPPFPPEFFISFLDARAPEDKPYILSYIFFFGAGAREGTAIIRRYVSDWLT